MSGAGWLSLAQQIWLASLLLFAPFATASAQAETDAGWATCAQQNEKQTAGQGSPKQQTAPCATVFAQMEETEQLIRQGREALAAGQAEQASLIFERIVLDQPWRLGVWLDYAMALQQMGDVDSARAIYQSLLRQNPPEYLVPWLTQQTQIAPPFTAGWESAGAITLLAGHDSNLNRAPTASALTLTLPSGPIVLPLSETSRASAGASNLMRMDWQAVHNDARIGNDWLLQATLNTRMAPGIKGQDYLQAGMGLSHRWVDQDAGEYRAILALQNLQYVGKDIQRTARAGLYRGQSWRADDRAGCSMYYGAEWDMFAYPSLNQLDGQYLGLSADLGCRHNLSWQFMLRAGVEQAEHQRPGGNQQRVELRGQFGGRLGAGEWLTLVELAQLHDTSGYSPLLENNAKRNIQRWLLKLEYQHPLGSRLQGLASTEIFQHNSNMPLFALRGKAAWLGIRYLF